MPDAKFSRDGKQYEPEPEFIEEEPDGAWARRRMEERFDMRKKKDKIKPIFSYYMPDKNL